MLRQPSLQKPYPDFFTGDPSVIKPPKAPEKDADEKAVADYKRELEEFRTKIMNAKETGDWSAITVPGETITQFVMGHVDRNLWRSLMDRAALPADNPRYIGPVMMAALLTRLSIQSIVGWDVKVERRSDDDWDGWTMAQPELIQKLDDLDTRIVSELGGGVFRRLQTISPKS